MSTSTLFYIIIAILIVQYIIDAGLGYLNSKKFKDPIPEELQDVFNASEYEKSQAYKKTNYRFGSLASFFSLLLTLSILTFGGFEWVDGMARSFTDNPILISLIFFGIIMIGSDIITMPISYYHTFVIEEKFGFNKSTKKTFFLDKIKGWGMTIIIGGSLLAAMLWFFEWAGTNFWIFAWAVMALFTIAMNLFYSSLIVPLFNKQTPLEEGSLKEKINAYSEKVGFELKNIFVIDGSKRSTKANAYFSGFGKQKRVTLYDTLIDDLDEEEIVAVLAHEIGHYKRKHIIFNITTTILLTGLTLFDAALIGFGILYSPISEITGLIMNYFSRKFEYEADDYAKSTFAASPLITSLKKLSKNSLSNLTPHAAYVFMHYSHPPLIERIKNLKA